MAKLLKLRRGTTTQHASFTGAEGEVTIDTTKDTAVVHDGSTAGGTPLAKEDLTNVSSSTIAGRLNNDSIAVSKIAAGTLPSDVKIQDANVSGNLTIESADIVDGTIVNADINASAAIANSKLADSGVSAGTVGSSTAIPIVTVNSKGIVTATSTTAVDSTTIQNGTSFVSVANNSDITISRAGTNRVTVDGAGVDVTGNFTSTGTIASNNITITDGGPKISFVDTNNNDDFDIKVNNGSFKIVDATDNNDRFAIDSSGNVTASGTFTTGSNVITGNITISGTVDGRDVASDGTKLDGITTGNVGEIPGTAALANGVTAATQSQGDNSTKVATTAYTDTAVANLVDSSPGALNTLNELAAAINDDASFSTTVNNNIATKMPKSGGEFTGDVTCEHIVPDGDSSRNLGSNSVRFANVYADNFVGSGANLTGMQAFVTGMIMMWGGSIASIPSGWALCNGSNGTPDLRDRFIVGAGSGYSVGATGGSVTATDTVNISGSDTVNISGSDTVNISGSDTVNISVGGNYYGQTSSNMSIGNYYHSYATNHMRWQTGYSYSDLFHSLSLNGFSFAGSDTVNISGSDNVNISGSDTVNISDSDTVSVDTRSPYYALCFIIKL